MFGCISHSTGVLAYMRRCYLPVTRVRDIRYCILQLTFKAIFTLPARHTPTIPSSNQCLFLFGPSERGIPTLTLVADLPDHGIGHSCYGIGARCRSRSPVSSSALTPLPVLARYTQVRMANLIASSESGPRVWRGAIGVLSRRGLV